MNQEAEERISIFKAEIKEKLYIAQELIKQKKDPSSVMKEIWNLSKKKFIEQVNFDSNLKEYEGIIFTIGFSPEPIILNIISIKPKCAYFIYTKDSEPVLDQIIEEANLKPSQYKREIMPRISAAASYNQVKQGLKFLIDDKGINKEKIALDPTGGTKIMSVGCGIAASIFNLDILYVNNQKYNSKLRRPEPGSEILISIPNPFDIYQDDKIIDGLMHLQTLHFSHAKETFYTIRQSSTNPLLPQLLALISEILYYWDKIDYFNALNSINKARKIIDQYQMKIPAIKEDLIKAIKDWEDYLKIITEKIENNELEVEKISSLLIYDIKANADREFYNQNYNSAALKYYRDIEMINQFILFNEYNINTQEPKIDDLPQKIKDYILKKGKEKEKERKGEAEKLTIQEHILFQYNEIWKKIYNKFYPNKEIKEREILPRRLGLVAGIIFRYIFGDSSIEMDFILRVIQIIESRNKSIFAHGIQSINKKNCQKLKKINEDMINKIDIDENLKNKVFSEKKLVTLANSIIKII